MKKKPYKGRGEVRLTAEVVHNMTNSNLGPVAVKVKNLGTDGLLVAPYVNRNLAEKLKGMGIPLMDSSGNVFINVQPYFIYVVVQANHKKLSVTMISYSPNPSSPLQVSGAADGEFSCCL